MKNTNEVTTEVKTLEPTVDAEQKAIEEIKALFEPANGGTRAKEKIKLYFFDRFRGKIKISLN